MSKGVIQGHRKVYSVLRESFKVTGRFVVFKGVIQGHRKVCNVEEVIQGQGVSY